jgi:DeoR/GlpR family transcriptional regulator of sugar metabolism
MLRSFRASKAIMGMDGISLEKGLTTLNFLEAGVKKSMIEASEEIIIVVDHTKFGKVCPIPVARLDRVSKIVTDTGVPEEMIRALERQGIQVLLAGDRSLPANQPEPNANIDQAQESIPGNGKPDGSDLSRR